ncbi:uncharacterized protein LOC113303743 [Papaver somniferum]|uniref:uncharacterized protein LOC113303743 n=1 Tax=Papaver somniferum TaxID=3469 RepID=UPI000E6FC84F|nr:uncharacterized protein LOC113303743 [Papaver somniferum]XP_026408601.1 uncharacterized protein LOC113303743 [Papaver somniferum]XP_026408602.1 uncharacterized protein LOC113303743 [Papaver somniferum]XP_026408603.1 uncharacterized protein LOC113303743 [Papaver somniferum]XP_026408604.1 uncharacterized protein LOC113303743 [Papaver somniferum]XP_026408605.1 uncharacterized protein LOC113303743 [Papaver somniferum]XP_026408606.1 uncharacterized protein LOC113303743 [Papaver somniferum]XP_0
MGFDQGVPLFRQLAVPENLLPAALDASTLAPGRVLSIHGFVNDIVKNTCGKPSTATLARHPLLRDPSSLKRKSPNTDTDSPRKNERRSKDRTGGFRSDSMALVTFSSSNVRDVNAFAQLARSQKTAALAAESGNAEPQRMAALAEEDDNAKPSCGEEELENKESSESSDDENNSSNSSAESSFSRSESESGETAPEDGPEAENHANAALSPTVEAAPGDPEMEVDQDKDVVAAQVAESAPATAGAILVRNPFPVAGSDAGAVFAPSYLVPYKDHVLIGGFSVPAKYETLYTKIWERYGHIATNKKLLIGLCWSSVWRKLYFRLTTCAK